MTYERTLEDIDNIIFDLDGTVWEWNRLKPGVKRTLETLRQQGKELKFFTNNAILRREQYAEKLRDLGVKVEDKDVLSASYVASEALDEENVRNVFVIGEDGLRAELKRNEITHMEAAKDVLVTVDRNYSYWKMARAADILREGGRLWTTTLDAYWWAGDRYLPGTNALVSSIKEASDTQDATILGKPSDYAKDVLRSEWSLRPNNTAFIGDNLRTDIVFGNKLGYTTGLVLGGTSKEEELQDLETFETPNIVFREFQRIVMKI